VYIPYPAGLKGHSDGDVALHAIVDALLGAAGLGDIGTLFPDNDPQWKNADSKEFLYAVREILDKKGWEIVNVDVTIHAEAPKLGPIKGQIRRCIAGLLGIDFADTNVKAKTNEGLGEIGAGEAMAATAIAMLRKKYKRTL
jgi:2-C-methyl-D-erythritol 2,4-cyclodiphosphate synthase